jgi:CheY-like chemotaxis protein
MIVDYHLPDMDGLALLRAFRRREHLAETPVLVFTADWGSRISATISSISAHISCPSSVT